MIEEEDDDRGLASHTHIYTQVGTRASRTSKVIERKMLQTTTTSVYSCVPREESFGKQDEGFFGNKKRLLSYPVPSLLYWQPKNIGAPRRRRRRGMDSK